MLAVLEMITALAVLVVVVGCGADTTSDTSPSPITMSWTVKTLDPVVPALFAVDFVDAQHGWAVGAEGTIVATEDGGASWAVQESDTYHWLLDVAFVDQRTGWAVGGNGVIVATRDGGDTWKVQRPGESETGLRGVSFIDARHGWAVGWNGALVSTVNGGRTWTAQTITDQHLNAVCFVDRKHGWAVGGNADESVALATEDGGAHWDEQRCSELEISDVTFLDTRHGQAAAELGMHSTEDGGDGWFTASTDTYLAASDTYFRYLGVSMLNPPQGWAVAWESNWGTHCCLSTSDGGRHWRVVWRSRKYFLNDIDVLPNGSVVAVGESGDHGAVLRGMPKSGR